MLNGIEEQKKSDVEKKSPIAGIVSVIITILAVGMGNYLAREAFSNKSNKTTVNNVVSYFNDTSTWKDFNSTLGNFSASFPVYPSHESTPQDIPGVGKVNTETYSADQTDGTTYMVSFTTFPKIVDTSVPENNLEGSINGTIQGVGGTLISSKFSSLGDHKAVDYLIHITEDDMFLQGKNILVDHTIYQIGVAYGSKNSVNAQSDRFINSFQLQ